MIPTARSITIDYLRPLIDYGARFIVVFDSEEKMSIDHAQFTTYNWADQDRTLGADAIAIPRRNGACRDFGFYIAWRESDPGEIVIALDDDEVAEEKDFALRVERALSDEPRPVATGAGRHFNMLQCFRNIEANVFPRGFPYSRRASYEKWTFEDTSSGTVAFNLGLWREIFDVNAIDKLRGPAYRYPDAQLQCESVVVPSGALISVCAGNMQFRRELIPAVYQLPMHVEIMPGWVIDRYGDIWGGFILKTLMDIKGELMSVGGPMIRHLKEGAYERNIWQEHICHLVNDEFISILETARTEIKPAGYLTMMEHITDIFDREQENCSDMLGPYVKRLVPAMRAWHRVLSN